MKASLKKLWDNTVDEALDKEIKSSELPKFWLEKKAAASLD